MSKIFYLSLFIAFYIFLGCENPVDTAKTLWEQNKQNEAIAKLEIVLASNPNDEEAKSLLDQYNISIDQHNLSITINESKRLWDAGDNKKTLDFLSKSIKNYSNNTELKNLYNEYINKIEKTIGKIYGNFILPTDKKILPLLSTDPINSFSFILFYSEEELKRISQDSIEENRIILTGSNSKNAYVKLSSIKGFNTYYKKIKKLSRYDLADKSNEIKTIILRAHKAYKKEYDKYLNLFFEVYNNQELQRWFFKKHYSLDNQTLNLPIIGRNLNSLIAATTPKNLIGNNTLKKHKTKFVNNKYWGIGPNGIIVNLPAKKAQELSEGKGAPTITYRYITEMMPGYDSVSGLTGFHWTPSFFIYKIEIVLKNNNGNEIVRYLLENIEFDTIDYASSFDSNTYTK